MLETSKSGFTERIWCNNLLRATLNVYIVHIDNIAGISCQSNKILFK